MSDYGLLSRKLALDVEYNPIPGESTHVSIPVFAVGREQLYGMFGLNGRVRTRSQNHCSAFYNNPDAGRYAIVIGFKRVNDEHEYEYSSTVFFWNTFLTAEDCFEELRFLLEVDSEEARFKYYLDIPDVHFYEVWQICDDSELYGEWNVEVMAHVIQRSVYGVGACDRKHEPNSKLFSEDYLSSLKTYNEYHLEALRQLREAGELERKSRMKETCYFCGCFLPGKNYSVQVGDEMKLVCRACFNLYNNDDYKGLRGRTFDTFICDCCGRTMKEKYYVDTSIGVYCSECKAENPDLGEYFFCDRCGNRLSVEHLSHTVSGMYCKHCKSVLCEGLSSCCGDICDPGTFPDPTCHGCEYSNRWSLYYE